MCSPAVSCSERGLKPHLLLRGEQPEILTGYNLISTVYGNVTYVPRSLYANREKMLKSHADYLAGSNGNVLWFDDILEASLSQNDDALNLLRKDAHRSGHPRKIVIVNEGAGDVVALLGNINGFGIKNRLVACMLASSSVSMIMVFGPKPPIFPFSIHIFNCLYLLRGWCYFLLISVVLLRLKSVYLMLNIGNAFR